MNVRAAATWFLTVAASWFLMQAVHELGHVLGAWATGGTVVRVVLDPRAISRTDVAPNPAPLAVAWAGPLLGIGIPVLLAAALKRFASRACGNYATFFAGFCLVANGAYIGFGSWEGVGDAGDMLRNGSPRWLLVAFGAAACVAGLWMWHTLGRDNRQPKTV